MVLFFLGRGNHHQHPLALELRHLLGLAVFLQLEREAQKQFFALLGEEDRASAEEDISLDFGSFLQETLGVVELELEIMFVGLGTEANLLDDHLRSVRLLFLRLLFLLIDEFLVVDDLAYGRIGVRSDLHKIQFPFFSHLQRLCKRIDTLLGHIVSHHADTRGGDGIVDSESFVLVLPVLREPLIRFARGLRSRFRGSVVRCYGLVLL